MGTVKEYLEDSELGKFENVFPELAVPTLGADADGYLRTLAACAIEQIKFLNSYAEIPVATLYENVGQRNKANNLAVLSFLRKTGTEGEGLGLIAIPGEQEGSYSAYNAGKIPDDLWKSQQNLLEQQNAYLDDVKNTFAEKRENLKVGFDMKAFVSSNIFKIISESIVSSLVDWITDLIPGIQDDLIFDTVANYTPRAIGLGMIWLHKQFMAGAVLCERMKEENLQLLKAPQTFDMYRMRSDIISQHDISMQSLLSQIALVETQLMQDISGQAQGATDSEPAIRCPHTGDFIFAHSRGKMTNV